MSDAEFLFARPSFLEGWARIGDFPNRLTEYNYAANAVEADALAQEADWGATGSHLRNAILRARDEILASRATK